jgi:hypothetical protein
VKSTHMRKPGQDTMLAPGSAALILIDYQPPQASTVESIDRFMLINNFVALVKTDLDQFIPDRAVQSEALVGKH